MKHYNKNQIGKKYNRLTILGYSGKDNSGRRKVLCKCECGNITVQGLYSVVYGNTKSCGCYRKDKYRIHKLKLWPIYEDHLHSH